MPSAQLRDFIGAQRDELITRCTAKSAERSGSTVVAHAAATTHGVPLFLTQLRRELTHGMSQTDAIATGAREHGLELLRRGFTVSQVVHDYGDVCQVLTDLAVETNTTIDTDDFRTLNRCLDDAIAGAVTAHASEVASTRQGESPILRAYLAAAIAAFEALESGRAGLSGSTGALLSRSLHGMREFLGTDTTTTT